METEKVQPIDESQILNSSSKNQKKPMMRRNELALVNLDMGVDITVQTPEYAAALEVHERLLSDIQMVSLGLCNMCKDLKEMRDMEYYSTLGFESFGDYTESVHCIGERQAYKYIAVYEKLGVDFLNSSSKIGITKLNLLSSLDSEERDELLSEYSVDNLEEMSVSEVKALTEKVKKLEEQISMFENAEPELTEAERAGLEAMYKTELDGKYANKIAELEASLESVKKDLIICEGEKAQSEKDYDELRRENNALSSENYKLKNMTVDVSPFARLKMYYLLLDKILSSIRYSSVYFSLSADEIKSVNRDIYGSVYRYFGEKA